MASDRISVNPDTCSGKPHIRGTRIMVKNILGTFAGGYTIERILETYPELAREDVQAALNYARVVVDGEKVILRGGEDSLDTLILAKSPAEK